MKKIKLHIGAHKTATTHIQQLLATNRKNLLNQEIHLSTPSDLRPQWLPLFLSIVNNKNEEKINKLYSLSPSEKIWIFSEENFSGSSYDLTKKENIYPNLRQRLSCFCELFNQADIEVFFSIRSYESYYRSAYLEIIRNRGYLPFNEFYNIERFQSNSWINVISSIASVIPQNKITIWKYEDTKLKLPYLLAQLTELEDTSVLIKNYKPKITRPSISEKTLRIIKGLNKIITPEEAIQLIEHLNHRYPANKNNGIFQPFTRQQQKQFRLRYKKNIKYINDNFPEIKFIS